MLASSLQIAYNLKSLPELMHNLISDLIQRMEDHVRTAFDISKLSKDALAKGEEMIFGKLCIFSTLYRSSKHKPTFFSVQVSH
jgi:hypothetical protein